MLRAYRLYTGSDGNSHVERGSVSTGVLVEAESILFKETPAHSAPLPPSAHASSQTERRGQLVRQASSTSEYGRGVVPNHSRRSRTRQSSVSVIGLPKIVHIAATSGR